MIFRFFACLLSTNRLYYWVRGHKEIDLETGMIEIKNIEEDLDSLAVAILPENLKQLRKGYLNVKTGKIGLTQQELADILDVSLSAIKKYESHTDSSIPNSHTLAKMCILYNTELYFSPLPEKRHPALPDINS